MQTIEITHELENTTKELLQVLSSFRQDQLNQQPSAGGWTAGQVAEHLIKASIVESLCGPTKPAERAPDQYVAPLREQFLDFTTKMDSPEFILPEEKIYQRERLVQALETNGAKISAAIPQLDLSAICLQLPKELGELTRRELIYFHIFHTQRHTHQLKQIYKQVEHQITRQASV